MKQSTLRSISFLAIATSICWICGCNSRSSAGWQAISQVEILGPIRIDPARLCQEEPYDLGQPLDLATREVWLRSPLAHAALQSLYSELDQGLHPQVVGVVFEEKSREVIVVLDQEHGDPKNLASRLQERAGPLKVVIRPACFPTQAIEEVRDAMADYSNEQGIPPWHAFRPRFAGYAVVVSSSQRDIADKIKARFGDRVRIYQRSAEETRTGVGQSSLEESEQNHFSWSTRWMKVGS